MKHAPLILAAFLAGCATASPDERTSLLAESVNCNTARGDIDALEEALPSGGERAASLVRSVTPVGAVVGVVTGSYGEQAAVLTGRTKEELEDRIKEIQDTCGIVGTTDGDSE